MALELRARRGTLTGPDLTSNPHLFVSDPPRAVDGAAVPCKLGMTVENRRTLSVYRWLALVLPNVPPVPSRDRELVEESALFLPRKGHQVENH